MVKATFAFGPLAKLRWIVRKAALRRQSVRALHMMLVRGFIEYWLRSLIPKKLEHCICALVAPEMLKGGENSPYHFNENLAGAGRLQRQ